jgi:hypothetical protein
MKTASVTGRLQQPGLADGPRTRQDGDSER